jgi:hypothetical protein
MSRHLPSVHALCAPEDGLLHQELRCLAVREQAALVRALAAELECLAPWGATLSRRQQLVEELARLGCRLLEAAASLSEAVEPQSGILPVDSDDISAAS